MQLAVPRPTLQGNSPSMIDALDGEHIGLAV